jgi:tight adherence protein C
MAVGAALLCAFAAFLGARAALGAFAAPRLRVLQGPEPLNRPFSERVLRPALGAVGGMLGRLLPARLLASTESLLHHSGLRGRPADWLGARLLCAAALGGYGAALTSRMGLGPLAAAAGVVLGWSLPGLYLQSRAKKRALAIRDDLPDAMDLLTVCVEAGLGFDQALSRVVERFAGPVGAEFGRVLRDQRLGTPRRQAMLAVCQRVDLAELRAFVHAVLQAEELGVRIGTVLRVQSDSLREQRRQRAEEEAMKAPIKMAFPMIFLILPSLFLVVLGPAVIQGIRALGAAHP